LFNLAPDYGVTTFSLKTFSIMTVSKTGSFTTHSKYDSENNNIMLHDVMLIVYQSMR
jgi:hypothetical protein